MFYEHITILYMENQYDLESKSIKLNKKHIPNKKYTRKVYTKDEINDILKDYIEIDHTKFISLKPGNTRVCYLRLDDKSFCRGGFINVNPIEKNDGSEIYMQLRGNIRKTNKNNVVWLLPYSSILKLWVFAGPEYDFCKQEIDKASRKHKKELSIIIDKISQHIRTIKHDIRNIKNKLDEDNNSIITDFSNLKVYTNDD